MNFRTRLLFVLCILILCAISASAQTTPVIPTMERKPLFQIQLQGDAVTVTLYSGDSTRFATGRLSAMKQYPDSVTIGSAHFEQDSLRIGGVAVPYDLLYDVRIDQNSSRNKVFVFLSREPGVAGTTRVKGNRRSFTEPIAVDSGDFVRGMVFSIAAPVTIKGEVNRSVVSLFGNITLTPSGVVRGHIITLNGTLHVDRASAVYGDIAGSSVKRKGRQRYNFEFSDYITPLVTFSYNRVDGAAPMVGMEFHDPDSTLPTIAATAGYAFASKRARLRIAGIETLNRAKQWKLGGAFIRDLAPSGDWPFNETENTFAALLAREDFRDYYESIGGSVWTSIVPHKHLRLTTGYQYEATNWLDAHHNLWSLFGGDKKFMDNYRYLDSAHRESAMSEIDTSTNGMLHLRAEYSTRSEGTIFGQSSWTLAGSVAWSLPSLGSDFDYSRYLIEGSRVQKLHFGGAGYIRAAYGGRGGTLPLHEQFFLGGPTTLRGYKSNRFAGDNVLMLNLEYREEIPGSMFSVAAFYDAAVIQNKVETPDKSLSDAPGLSDAGLAFYLFYEKGILSLTWPTGYKPDGNSPIFYARLKFAF